MDAIVLDVYSERDRMVVWLREAREGGTAIRIEEPFVPSFFVRAPRARLRRLQADVACLPGAGEPRLTTRLCALEEHPSEVLEVPIRRHDRIATIAGSVDEWGEFRDFDLYDVDIRMSHRWCLDRGLFPFARIRAWAPGVYRLLDDQWAIDYEPPPLRVRELETLNPEGRPILTIDEPIGSARLGDVTLEGSEPEILTGLAAEMKRQDPDLLLTWGGDSIVFPHLLERARALGLRSWGLGRDGSPPVIVRKGRSYFSYGKILYRPGPVRIPGRIHIDYAANNLSPPEAGLDGLVEQARITSTPLQEVVRLTTGTAFSTMQIDVAKREGRIIPYRKNFPETPKDGRTYILADRGALSYDPQVGVHDDVWEFDFASFFPNLMIHRNLSPETVLCSCCDPTDPSYPRDRIVPRVGYHVCRRRDGINAKTLARLVDRRAEYKRRRKTRPDELQKWQARSDLLKMELVCSFGYQGHKNHRHGRIEVHEAINAWARHDLPRGTAIARDCGFEPLHGLSDSLWLKRIAATADAEEVARRVEEEVGVPFDVQGRFKWIVFLPNKSSRAPDAEPVGALTRFYGMFDGPVMPTRSNGHQKLDYLAGGKMKVRGVELRQRSTPAAIRRVQEVLLERLAHADDSPALRRAVPDALAEARPLLDAIRRGDVPLVDLVILNSVSREVEEFTVRTHAWAALTLLKKANVRVPPGEGVYYVVRDAKAREAADRVTEARIMRGDEEYDPEFYLGLAYRAISSLLLPFGFTEERVAEHYAASRQSVLF